MNRRLYVDCLKQIRIVGIIGTVILSVVAVFLGYGNTLLEYSSYLEEGVYSIGEPNVCDFGAYFYLFIYAIGLFAPIMALIQFSFLHKRNSSDFFHALPVKRGTMYWSMLAAVATWTAVMVFIPMTILLFFYGFCQFTTFEVGRVFQTLLVTLVIFIMIIGAIMVAVGSTGTTFTNLVVAFILLFVPRIVSIAITYAISTAVVTLPFDGVEGFFGVRTNALFCMGYQTISGVLGAEIEMPTTFSIIYTGAVGLAYLGIGYFSFTRRPSEVASMPSFSKVWQAILRLIPATCVSMIGTIILAFCFLGEMSADNEAFFYILLTYVFAIVAYFLYELVTTRSWRAVGKSAKYLPILLLLNLIIFCGVLIPSRAERTVRMDADKVVKIEISRSENSSDIAMLENIGAVEDTEAIAYAVEAYNGTMEYYYGSDKSYEIDFSDYYKIKVSYYTKYGKWTRIARFTPELYNKFVNRLQVVGTKELNIPDYNSHSMDVGFNGDYRLVSIVSWEDAYLDTLISTWKKEVVTAADYMELADSNSSNEVLEIVMTEKSKGKTYRIPISQDTPKTMTALIGILKEYQNDYGILSELEEEISDASENAIDSLDIEMCYFTGTDWASYGNYWDEATGQEIIEQNLEALKQIVGDYDSYEKDDYSAGDVLLCMDVSITFPDGSGNDVPLFMNVSAENFREIREAFDWMD